MIPGAIAKLTNKIKLLVAGGGVLVMLAGCTMMPQKVEAFQGLNHESSTAIQEKSTLTLRDRLEAMTPTASRPAFTCPRYAPPPGEKRCRHFVSGGACDLPDELMCIEWLKANSQPLPLAQPPSPTAVITARLGRAHAENQPSGFTENAGSPLPPTAAVTASLGTALTGNQPSGFTENAGSPPPPTAVVMGSGPVGVEENIGSARPSTPAGYPERGGVHEPSHELLIAHYLTGKEVRSFKALGTEICIASEILGKVWIVPEYTGVDRTEMTVEHAATIAAFCAAFPQAKVVHYGKAKPVTSKSESQI